MKRATLMAVVLPFLLLVFAQGQEKFPGKPLMFGPGVDFLVDDAGNKYAMGFKPPTPQQRAALYAIDRVRNGGRVARAARMLAAPEKFDCVEMGWVPPVRDQGNCGSCYGVATADQLTCTFIKAGYQKNDDSFEINFQFGLDRCGPNFGGCNGGWGSEVAEWMLKNGWPAERYVDASGKTVNDYPAYEARPRNCREKAGAKRWKPAAWGYCGPAQRSATVAEIKASLMQYGVVNIAFNATNAYANAGKNVVRIVGQANHETTLVGWDDTKNGGKGAWKTRGNWGKGLGDGGYVWFTYDSQLVDPFWMSANPLPPPPDPDPPTPPGPGPDPYPPGTIFGRGTLQNGVPFMMVPDGMEVFPAGTKAKIDAIQQKLKELEELFKPREEPPKKMPKGGEIEPRKGGENIPEVRVVPPLPQDLIERVLDGSATLAERVAYFERYGKK